MAGAATIESLMNSNEINEMLQQTDSDNTEVNTVREHIQKIRDTFFGKSDETPDAAAKKEMLLTFLDKYVLADKTDRPYFELAYTQIESVANALGSKRKSEVRGEDEDEAGPDSDIEGDIEEGEGEEE